MKTDSFTKVILSGILVCLVVITFKMNFNDNFQTSAPDVEVSNQGGRVVQIAPNRVGVVDTGNGSGWEQLVVFEYNQDTKKFEVVSSLTYEDIFNHPKENGIPVRDDKYGD
ncbi:hypothetical protein QNH16_09295 [Peribacillus frigoritolerans]|uniref:hypothetical protein n=1 Tax=Peribacillus frigoritolerans TaxID=450367 RepID=UPI0024BFC042|nr:hypothetical protein [Peribacillus frigoritolerans]WHY15805.1 hypothetical protein QNH16_09295 [Peribacillus frigoritolerans]